MHLQLHPAAAAGSIGAYTDAGATALPGVAHTPLAVWRHIALVASHGKASLYVDGQLMGTNPLKYSRINPASAIHIGNGYQGGRFFKGHIGEVAIYDHALSPERIQLRSDCVKTGNKPPSLDAPPVPRAKATTLFSVLTKDFSASAGNTFREAPNHSNLTATNGQIGFIEYRIDFPSAGKYRLHALMTAAQPRPCTLTINGAAQDPPILGETTGGWLGRRHTAMVRVRALRVQAEGKSPTHRLQSIPAPSEGIRFLMGRRVGS